jgi:chromosomal replication initiation ATPase DnaA
MNAWAEILERMRAKIPEDDFRRWFGQTAYASDSGDQLTVWVPSEAIRRHIATHYERTIERELEASGRGYTHVRMVVTGGGEDDDDE